MRRIATLVLVICTLPAWSQATIKGIVISRDDKSPLPGVNVVEKGTYTGTSTKEDGTFSLDVSDSNAILVFSFIGFATQEYPLNGKDYIIVKMETDCSRDWFDAQHIGLSAVSGLIHTPVGGQFYLSFPGFLRQTTLKSTTSFQTDLDKNQFTNSVLELDHIAVRCDFDMAMNWHFRSVSYENDFNSKINSFEVDFNFSRHHYWRLVTGYSHLNFERMETNGNKASSGPLVGLGTSIGRPLHLLIVAKASVFNNIIEYQGQMERRFSRRITTFARFYKLDTFSELSLGIGADMTYYLKKGQRPPRRKKSN